MVKAVFFDVANTLLYKPDLFKKINEVLNQHGLTVDEKELQKKHRLLSEVVLFPDKTSKDFYAYFNKELIYLLGYIPSSQILDEIFFNCSYLPWKAFEDTTVLNKIDLPIGIISNWDKTLPLKLSEHFTATFEWILGSELEGVRKPDELFYSRVIVKTGLKPEEIVYVGDSIKLDIEPAHKLGIQTVLIDRLNSYPDSNLAKIQDLREILNHL